MRLCLIASKPTDSVIFGFLPAAARLGLEVVLLTDQPEEHERARARSARGPARAVRPRTEPAPDGPGDGPHRSVRFVGLRCVGRPRADRRDRGAAGPARDRLQLRPPADPDRARGGVLRPAGKDWRSAMRAKNKSLMRRRLAETGIEHVAAARDPGRRRARARRPARTRWCSSRPRGWRARTSCSSRSPEELAERSAQILARRPGETLLAEEYLPGELRTLETLGDGKRTWVLGGFRTSALAAALLHRGAAHLGRARAGRGAGTRARRARRARRHVRRVSHRVRSTAAGARP